MMKTLQSFTQETIFGQADLEDLGEAGLVDVSLRELFAEKSLLRDGKLYDIDRFIEIRTKVVPENNGLHVYLYGTCELV